MKVFLTLLAVGACLAYPDDADNKYGMHYSQHRTSVDTARQGMQERLSKLEAQTLYQRQLGGSENYAVGCTTGCGTGSAAAYTSRSSSSQSSQRSSSLTSHENSEYAGVGIVGHGEQNDLQQRMSSGYSSGSAFEADDLQQRRVPSDLSNIQSSAYRQASRSRYRADEEEEDELQRSVGAGYHDLSVNNDRYAESQSQRRTQYQKESQSEVTASGRPVYVIPGGSASTAYRSSAANTDSQYTETRTLRPVAVGQHVSLVVRPGTSTVLTIPVSAQDVNQQRVYSASNRRDYQAVTESSRTGVQPGYQVNYYPSYTDRASTATGSRTDSESSRTTSYQQPEKLISNEYSSSRTTNEESEEEDTQQKIVPANTGTSRISSTRGGSSSYQQQGRVIPVAPIRTVESTSSLRTAEEEDTQQKVMSASSVTSRYGSTSGGSTNYQQGYTSSRVVPIVVPVVPVHTVESTSSQKTAEELEQRRYSQARPIYSHRTASRNENEQSTGTSSQYSSGSRPLYSTSRSSANEGQQYGTSGTTYYTAPVNSQSRTLMSQSQQGSTQSQYAAGSAAQTQYQAGSQRQQTQMGSGSRTAYGAYNQYPVYSSTSGLNSQRGSSNAMQSRINSHTMSSNSGDLMEFMSESERLAKIQQGQIAAGSSSSSLNSAAEANRRTINTASNLDSTAANFVSSTNTRLGDLDNVENLAGTGGYKRVKSWQKQSKWASGSEYGSDGKPKSYSMLSTAESEKHNINGAETGYKAATTTLENDGKVSTYSIHTP